MVAEVNLFCYGQKHTGRITLQMIFRTVRNLYYYHTN